MLKNAPLCIYGENFSIITCKCGAKVMLVPDIRAMNKAIEFHLLAHKKKMIACDNVDMLRDNLYRQLFDLADKAYSKAVV